MIIPLLLVAGGVAMWAMFITKEKDLVNKPVPQNEPDELVLPVIPGTMPITTGYKRVDAILDLLKKASESSKVPLGFLIGWIARESGGKLYDVSKLDERGYFQISVDESKSLGLDHKRLSIDPIYSINGGLMLIGKYIRNTDKLDIASKGTPYYWKVVKLGHTIGEGGVHRIVTDAKAAGQTVSWEALRSYATAAQNDEKYKRLAPKKWFPLVDEIYATGKPFGFGSLEAVVGAYPTGPVYNDIPDPLDIIS